MHLCVCIYTHKYLHTFPGLTDIHIPMHIYIHSYIYIIIYTNKNHCEMYLSSILMYRLKWMNLRSLSVINSYDYEEQYIYQWFSTLNFTISNKMLSKRIF